MSDTLSDHCNACQTTTIVVTHLGEDDPSSYYTTCPRCGSGLLLCGPAADGDDGIWPEEPKR